MNRLWSHETRQAFALVDAARDAALHGLLTNSGLKHLCLFSGTLSPALSSVAPYLVHLESHARFTDDLLDRGCREGWAILAVVSPDVGLSTLREHFRRFLRATGEDGRILYFRFYDPFVMRIYLASCDSPERRTFFGPVESFLCPVSGGGEWTRLEREAGHQHEQTAASGVEPAIRLRRRQLDAFRESAEQLFVDRLVEHLLGMAHQPVIRLPQGTRWRNLHAEALPSGGRPSRVADLRDRDLEDLVRTGMARARGHGLTSRWSVASFVTLMFLVAPNFDEQPRVRRILGDESLSPDERMDAVVEAMGPIDYAQAWRDYDALAWQGARR